VKAWRSKTRGAEEARKRREEEPGEEINSVTQIWDRIVEQPKTSVAGLLLALTTVLGVLQQQGVSLGHVGTGTAVSLGSALATAMLGLLAKDK
jgi:hypothetical protein